MNVTIPAKIQHEGIYSVVVTIKDTCPTCGQQRGKPTQGTSYDGSRRLSVDMWKNPCGHIDKYSAVRKEAAENGLNKVQVLST
jgi:hypothetical protein